MVASAAVCQGPAAWASMDKKTPNRHSESGPPARVVSTVQLSRDERAFMLTSWISPVVAWVSQAYCAPAPVIRQLKLVYHVAMGTKSWGITPPILSRPRLQGGLALPEPELFLMHQAAAPFVSLLGKPHKYPNKAMEAFYAWAASIGFTPSKDNLPYTPNWAWFELRD